VRYLGVPHSTEKRHEISPGVKGARLKKELLPAKQKWFTFKFQELTPLQLTPLHSRFLELPFREFGRQEEWRKPAVQKAMGEVRVAEIG